ncbi:DUF308 domain-containing protein [Paracoccus sp. DMF-8]|uniref:HdeD family acid-resistance protein n=1 Tax=Paracoccus sp. DMF-8 TaxID=3019445 RepID=UPI0023E36864|nr:DUF308 domain-containing protein [Paracoccus sp. DMF-8]MDF3607227.1 DUF308 domain-containing protein [Paracoccus sp. DMF-8]
MQHSEFSQTGLAVLRAGWWMLLVRGIAAVLFGLIALLWPGLTAYALLIAFGAFALVDGVFSIVAVTSHARGPDGQWMRSTAGRRRAVDHHRVDGVFLARGDGAGLCLLDRGMGDCRGPVAHHRRHPPAP